jgi:outer membrane receptor protein involved in Fe transport
MSIAALDLVRRALLTGGSAAIVALLAPVAAHAQDAAPQAADDVAANDQEIVITATKRAERLGDVAASVTVLSAEKLSSQGVVKFEDYAARVPGLSLTSARTGQAQVTLRGITTGPAQSASATSFYIDEAPIGSVNAYTTGSSTTPDLDPSDLARLEVLKGPQGTLYGAGSVGGLLKFVTTGANFTDVTGRIAASINTVHKGEEGYAIRGAINVPLITDKLAIRASAFHRKDAGYIDIVQSPTPGVAGRDVNSAKVSGGRVLLSAKLGETVQADLQGIIQDTKVAGANVVDVDGTTLNPLYGDLNQRRFTREGGRVQLKLVNGTIRADLGVVDLVSSTTYQTVKSRVAGDGSFGFGVALGGIGLRTNQETRVERFSQELRFDATGIAGGLLDTQLGLYYTHEDDINRIPSFDPFNPLTGAALPFPPLAIASIKSKYTEYSVFANATVHFTDQFDILVGGRFAHDKQKYAQDYRGAIVGATPLIYNSSEKGDIFTYLVNPRFKISPDAMIYGRLSTGYRPGGPNAVPPPALFPGVPTTFSPDKLTSYELGVKASLFDRMVTVDAAVFLTNWNDIQIQTSAGGFNFFVNGGTARSKGFEISTRFMPVRGLVLGLNNAYTDARLTTAAPAAGGLDGDRLPFVPRWAHSASAQYDWPIADGWTAQLGTTINYVGKRVSNYTNRALKQIPDYTTVNLNAGIEHGGWSLSVYAKNLTDKRGITALGSLGLTPASNPFGMAVIQPRTFGAELALKF